MASVGDVISNPAARMRLRFTQTAASTGGELLEMEATYEPASNPPPEHYHPSQDERFEIREGTMRVRIAGAEERDVGAGESIDVPRETVHAMWNPGPERAVVVWQTRPALRTERFFELVAELAAGNDVSDELGGKDLLTAYGDVFRLP